jgi:hypothetical protein
MSNEVESVANMDIVTRAEEIVRKAMAHPLLNSPEERSALLVAAGVIVAANTVVMAIREGK